ncbi:MAG TPA: Clp protease N-terminal domain-containing protein [Gemmatimonadaceae bacterium]|nr:Clp protease N-terminal domain-containing protein [Gemmatimonadaceae bacterium]
MSWKSGFTDRAEDTLGITRIALRRRPSALASTEILRAIEGCGPSLARGVLTALDVNIDEVLDCADQIAREREANLRLRRFPVRLASLEMIVRRAEEEAAMLGHRRVGTEHLLLAMISVHDDPTTSALRAAGVTQDTARGTIRRLLVSWTDNGTPRPRVSAA